MALEFADSNQGRIVYAGELQFGIREMSYDGQITRISSSSLVANKGTTVSDELRADAMVADLIETDFTTGGDFSGEMSLGGTWNEFIEAVLRSDEARTPTVYSSTSLSVLTSNNSYTASGGEFVNVTPGDWIYAANFTNPNNNGFKKVQTVTPPNQVTVLEDGDFLLSDEPNVAQPNGTTSPYLNATEKRSFSIEQYFGDIDVAQLFLGQRVGTWALNVSSGAVVTTTMGFSGSSVEAQSSAYYDTPAPATQTQVVGATANVASVWVDQRPADCQVQSITLNVDNGLRFQNAVGDKFPCGIGYGRQTITGSMTVYFQDLIAYNNFLDHDAIAIWWQFEDNAGNAMKIKLPRVKYTAGSPQLEGIDTDVTLSLDFQALASTDFATGDEYQIEVADFQVAV